MLLEVLYLKNNLIIISGVTGSFFLIGLESVLLADSTIEEIKSEIEPKAEEVENKFEAVDKPLIEVISATEANAKPVSKEEETVIDNTIGTLIGKAALSIDRRKI